MFAIYKPLNNIVMINTFFSKTLGYFFKQLSIEAKDEIEADRKLYFKISEKISAESSDMYRLNHMRGSDLFKYEWFEGLRTLEREFNKPESFFFDKKLESLKIKLSNSITRFFDVLDTNTFIQHNDFHRVPEMWKATQPERYNKIIKDINTEIDSIRNNANRLIKIGKKKLRI